MDAEILRVPLSRGLFATIDVADEWVTRHRWFAFKDGHTSYAATNVGIGKAKRPALMHRMLLGFPESFVDHRDGDGLNNRRENIRLATRSQNQFNRRKTEGMTSCFKGVNRKSNGKFQASISLGNNAKRWSRVFTSEETAARAYDVKAAEWFGEFARLNFPDELEASREIVAHALIHDRYTALTEESVRTIRRMKAEGRFASQIAAAIGANQKTVESVIQGHSWKHVADEVTA
jgi:hypothetical protein